MKMYSSTSVDDIKETGLAHNVCLQRNFSIKDEHYILIIFILIMNYLYHI